MVLLSRKLVEYQEKLNNPLFSERQVGPYVKIVAGIQEALAEHTWVTLAGPLRKQLQPNREERGTAKLRGREVIEAANLTGLLSHATSIGSPLVVTVLSANLTILSKAPSNVVLSLPMRTLSRQPQQAPPAGSPEVLSHSCRQWNVTRWHIRCAPRRL